MTTTNIKFLLKLIKIGVNIHIDFWHVLFPNQLAQLNCKIIQIGLILIILNTCKCK